MANWKRRLWKWTAGTFAALVILLAALAGLFRLLTPLVPGYRAEVEQWASGALQHPVEIHSMSAEWGWHGPEATLEGVRILSRDRQRVVVAAQEVRLGLALSSLLHGSLPRPDRVVLVAPRIEVERDAQGVYDVRGLEGGAQKNDTDWHSTLQEIFAQRAEISVKGGQVTLFDARHAGPSVFQRIDINVDNSVDVHSIKGSAQLPPDFGRSLKFELGIQGQGLEPAAWDWHAQWHGTGLLVQRWLSYGPAAYQDAFTGGSLDVDGKLVSKQGELQQASLDIGGHGLMRAVVPGPTLAALQGKFDWQRKVGGWRLEGRKLSLRYGDSTWPVNDLDLEYASGPDGEHWAGDAGFLRLQDLKALSSWIPAGAGSPTDAELTRLRAFNPSGDLSGLNFKARWDGKAIQDWAVKAGFQDLGVHAAEGWPGFAGMDGSLDLATTGGQVRLAARDADVDFRPLFRSMLHADTADLDVSVVHDPKGWRFAADSFQVANADAAAHGRVALAFPADGSAPVLDLDASVDRADARNKSAYFPVGIMEKPLVKWLDDSIKSGQVVSGSVAIHGKTSDFPYRDDKGGTFDIQFHVQHAELDYMAGWPALKDLDAEVRFLDQGLEAKLKSGSFQGDALTSGTARFADLETGVLEIDGTARGSAANGLDFLRQGPLKGVLAGYLDGIAAKGDTDVGLHLHLPVTDVEAFKLQGKVTLHQVSIGPVALPALTAEHLEGVLDFGNYGFATTGVHGTLLGGPVDIAIHTPHTDHGNASSLSAHGIAEAQGLVPLLGHDAEHWLEGQTAWQVDGKLPLQAGVGVTGLNLTLRSELSGLALKLPAPFTKDVAAASPLRVVMKFEDEDDLGFTGNYGDALGLRLDFAPSQGNLGFERGELRIGAGTAARPSAPGLEVNGVLPAFVWDEWRPVLTASNTGEAQAAATRGRGNGAPSPLRSIDLDVGRVAGFGQTVDQLHIDLAPSGEGWQGRVDSLPLAGTFSVPAKVDAAHPILLDMDRADFGKPGVAAAQEVTKQAQSTGATEFHYDPRDIPALRLTSKHLQYGDMVLDNVGLALVPQPDGVALEDLKVAAPSFSITGDGTWLVTPAGQQRTTLNADVESSDVEKSLQALGFDPGITGDKGSIVAALNWQDSPLGDVTHTLAGSIHVRLTDGQLKEVQPGAGRVFGLLSLNALPRRILLNFSDVFAKGFGYDSIEGDFTLQDGDAYTQNLVMKGPAASIHLVGRTGLAKHDFDEALIVDASVGSTLPVVGALAAGVGVGAVVFLLTEIFKKPLTKAGEVRYHLTGTWDNPTLTKLPGTVPAATTRKQN